MVTANRRTSYDGVWLPKTLVNMVTVNRSLTSYDGVWLIKGPGEHGHGK